MPDSQRVTFAAMFSYSYSPSGAALLTKNLPRTNNLDPSEHDVRSPVDRCQSEPSPPVAQGSSIEEGRRIFKTLSGEDMVTLDCLIGVERSTRGYSFVQYRPTDKHKMCAGSKIDPVQLINAFVRELRELDVPTETYLHTPVPLGQAKTLWIRVSLEDLAELSLESLWMIKGEAKLYVQQRLLVISIDSQSLERCVMNPGSEKQLLRPDSNDRAEKLLELAKEGLVGRGGRVRDDSTERRHGEDEAGHEMGDIGKSGDDTGEGSANEDNVDSGAILRDNRGNGPLAGPKVSAKRENSSARKRTKHEPPGCDEHDNHKDDYGTCQAKTAKWYLESVPTREMERLRSPRRNAMKERVHRQAKCRQSRFIHRMQTRKVTAKNSRGDKSTGVGLPYKNINCHAAPAPGNKDQR